MGVGMAPFLSFCSKWGRLLLLDRWVEVSPSFLLPSHTHRRQSPLSTWCFFFSWPPSLSRFSEGAVGQSESPRILASVSFLLGEDLRVSWQLGKPQTRPDRTAAISVPYLNLGSLWGLFLQLPLLCPAWKQVLLLLDK